MSACPPGAAQERTFPDRRLGPRPCENSNARRARRNIFEKLRVLRTDNAADVRLDAILENCIFYISAMHEFSHSLGQKLPSATPKTKHHFCDRHHAKRSGFLMHPPAIVNAP